MIRFLIILGMIIALFVWSMVAYISILDYIEIKIEEENEFDDYI